MSYLEYSDKYNDVIYEYRLVTLPSRKRNLIEPGELLSEEEVKDLGIRQSPEWEHFAIFEKEPYVLIFRRKL